MAAHFRDLSFSARKIAPQTSSAASHLGCDGLDVGLVAIRQQQVGLIQDQQRQAPQDPAGQRAIPQCLPGQTSAAQLGLSLARQHAATHFFMQTRQSPQRTCRLFFCPPLVVVLATWHCTLQRRANAVQSVVVQRLPHRGQHLGNAARGGNDELACSRQRRAGCSTGGFSRQGRDGDVAAAVGRHRNRFLLHLQSDNLKSANLGQCTFKTAAACRPLGPTAFEAAAASTPGMHAGTVAGAGYQMACLALNRRTACCAD